MLRREFTKQKKLCLLCLKSNHMLATCNMKKMCNECNGKHNTLLHLYDANNNGKRGEKNEKKKAFVDVTEDENKSTLK